MDVLPKEKTRKPFNVDNVRVCKILGSGVLMSRVVRGIVFTRSAAGIVSQASDAKIAAYTADVDYTFTETKVRLEEFPLGLIQWYGLVLKGAV